jgi:hypothetical protein
MTQVQDASSSLAPIMLTESGVPRERARDGSNNQNPSELNYLY